MSFSYWSRVGFPLQVLSPSQTVPDAVFQKALNKDYRGFYKAGEVLESFVFPQNALITSHAELYSRYQLYENRGGLQGIGTPFFPESLEWVQGDTYMATSQTPLFVGDLLASDPSKTVSWALGTYKEPEQIWKIHLLFETVPAPLGKVGANAWTQGLIDNLDSLKSAIEKFLGQCVVQEFGPLNISAGLAEFENSMLQMKKALQEVQL